MSTDDNHNLDRYSEEELYRHRKYLENLHRHRRILDRIRVDLSNSFDKYLLSFATGTLYLSVFFTAQLEKVFYWRILGLGWALLLLVIFITLLSIHFSVLSHDRQIEITDEKIKAENDAKPEPRIYNTWNSRISLMRVVAIFGFTFGILALSAFYFISIVQGG